MEKNYFPKYILENMTFPCLIAVPLRAGKVVFPNASFLH
jgi:hypothetical protein